LTKSFVCTKFNEYSSLLQHEAMSNNKYISIYATPCLISLQSSTEHNENLKSHSKFVSVKVPRMLPVVSVVKVDLEQRS